MQIGSSSYFDLKIDGYDQEDFLSPSDVLDVQIVETAGSSLPYAYVRLASNNKDMLQYLIKNNDKQITITLGDSKEDADTFSFYLFNNTPPNTSGQNIREIIEMGGFLLDPKFMTNMETKTYKGNSLLVAKQVISDWFNAKPKGSFLTSVKRTNENQVTWYQTNEPASLFLAKTLLHMDIRPSFPLFSFDRYGNFNLRDFNVVSVAPSAFFVPISPKKTSELQYINNFNTDDWQMNYNLYSGFNKITEIWGATEGIAKYAGSFPDPLLASTTEVEQIEGMSRTSMNKIQSANVHRTYLEAFTHNTNRLMALSSICGCLEVIGYQKGLKPTDIVYVNTQGENSPLDGSYVIDTIRTQIDMKHEGIIHTYVYVTRDNRNNIENYVTNKKRGLKIRSQLITEVMNAVSSLRVAYAFGQQVIDGRFMKRLMSFAINTKQNLLMSFSINGVPIDFNSSASLLTSITSVGNSLMNTFTSMIFPEQIAYVFRDFIIRKPSLRGLLSKYIDVYVPIELRDIVSKIVDALFNTTNSLNSIAKENGISVLAVGSGTKKSSGVPKASDEDNEDRVAGERVENEVPDTSEQDYMQDGQDKVQQIISDFENNTNGLNVPFPVITLTESTALMPDNELKKYIAAETIQNLTNLGYLEENDISKFEEILLGEEKVDFNMIERINKNAGNSLSYRYWGTFEELSDLTEFYVKKCFKDRFRTIPCTKFINATGNQRFFFACPSSESDLRFYINSKRIEVVEALYDKEDEYENKEVLGSFPIKLGYYDVYGTPIPYTIYYTNIGYNSNSVLFEVKQGGMV